MLHLVNSSLRLPDLHQRLDAGDAVLLLGDSVTVLQRGHAMNQLLQDWSSNAVLVYALEEMIEALGLSDPDLKGITSVDFSGWVKLTEQHRPVLTWD